MSDSRKMNGPDMVLSGCRWRRRDAVSHSPFGLRGACGCGGAFTH